MVRVAPRLDLAGAPVPRSAVDALLAAAVAGGFDAPGRGDLRTKVEEYVPASDGRWHRVDAFGRVLPTTVAPVSPSGGGDDSDSDAGAPAAAATTTPPTSSPVSAAMGDRIRLLRAMLAWTKDVEAGGSGGRGVGDGAPAETTTTELPSSEELLVLVWPPGAIASVRRGMTAGALTAERAPEADTTAPALAAVGAGVGASARGADRAPVPPPPPVAINVNNRLVPPDTPLADGDFVVLTGAILENL